MNTTELLADKERLDHIEKVYCCVDEGINEIKMNVVIFVGYTKLRPGLDNSIAYYNGLEDEES